MAKKIIVFMLVIFIIFMNIFFLNSQSQTSTEFDKDDIKTWTNNIEKVLKMDTSERNKVLNQAVNPELRSIKEEVVKNIATRLSQIAVERQNNMHTVASATARLLGRDYPPLSENDRAVLENLKGFDSKELNFKDNTNIITDGNIELDLEKLPIGVTEIEYVTASGDKKNKFIYRFKDGSEIEIGGGKLHEDLTYESDNIPESKEEKGKVKLIPGEGRIFIDENGKFRIDGNAKVQVGERVFEKNGEGESSFNIVEGGHFRGRNTKVTTKETEIKIGDKETDIVFNKQKFSGEQFVQIADTTEGIKKIIMEGEDIEVKLLKEGLGDSNVGVYGKGKNLVVKNGESVWKIDDETFGPRAPKKSDVNLDLENGKKPEQIIETTVQPPVIEEGTPVTPPETTPQTETIIPSGTEVKKEDTSLVCIGKFCTYGALSLRGIHTYKVPIDYKPTGVTETFVLQTGVFAPAADVEAFKKIIQGNNWDENRIRQEAATFFNNVQSHTIVKKTDGLKWSQVNGRINEMIGKLGLDENEMKSVTQFKERVRSSLVKDTVPAGTQIVISTMNTGNEATSLGSFEITLPGKGPEKWLLPGTKFNKVKQGDFREEKYQISELLR